VLNIITDGATPQTAEHGLVCFQCRPGNLWQITREIQLLNLTVLVTVACPTS